MNITNKDRVNTYKHLVHNHNTNISDLQKALQNEKTALLQKESDYVKMLNNVYPLQNFIGKSYHYALIQVFEDSNPIQFGTLNDKQVIVNFKDLTAHGFEKGSYFNDEFCVDIFDINKSYVFYVSYSEMYDEENPHKDISLVLRDTPLNRRDIKEYLIFEAE